MTTPTGLLNINKPQGVTSRDVVNRVVRVLRQQTGQKKVKAGHCGTLDPMATGVLVVCVGQATRLVSMVQEQPKTYRGRFLLGRVTDTDDVTGQTVCETDLETNPLDRLDIERLLPEFTGRIEQVPPKFSAVHVDGKRAYDLARRGDDVKLEPRTVEVYRLTLESFDSPEFELLIECGSGTYVRSIGRDIGERLNCGATMSTLVRTAIGPYEIGDAVELDQLTEDTIADSIQPPDGAVRHLPALCLREDDIALVRNGRPVGFNADQIRRPEGTLPSTDGEFSRTALLSGNGELVAIAEPGRTPSTLKPAIVFNAG